VEKIVHVEVPVDKIVQVPVERITHVNVEHIVEKPVEHIVEKLVEKIVHVQVPVESTKLNIYVSENEQLKLRLASIERETIEMNALRLRISSYTQMERELQELKVRFSQFGLVEQRVALLISENERLHKICGEWQTKYLSLESLYHNVRETTEQLGAIERKYHQAVKMSETMEPRLRLSADNQVLRNSVIVERSVNPIETVHVVKSTPIQHSNVELVYSPTNVVQNSRVVRYY